MVTESTDLIIVYPVFILIKEHITYRFLYNKWGNLLKRVEGLRVKGNIMKQRSGAEPKSTIHTSISMNILPLQFYYKCVIKSHVF